MTRHVLTTELRRCGLPLWMVPLLIAALGLVFTQVLLTAGDRPAWATSFFFDVTTAVIPLYVLTLAVAAWRAGANAAAARVS